MRGAKMAGNEHGYLRDVQYRYPDRLKARALLHTRYGRGDWFDWLSASIPLPPGSTVADLGCGAGAFWTNAPSSIPSDLKLRLFDISRGMVEAARTSIGALKRWTDVQIDVADAEALPLADASIDTTIAVHMLYHLTRPEKGVEEMARITRRGGTVAVVLNPSSTSSELTALVRNTLGSRFEARAQPLSSEQGLDIVRGQFAQVDVVRYDDELRVTDPIDLLAYLGSLPFAEADGSMEKLAAAVDDAFCHSDGVFLISKASDLLVGRA